MKIECVPDMPVHFLRINRSIVSADGNCMHVLWVYRLTPILAMVGDTEWRTFSQASPEAGSRACLNNITQFNSLLFSSSFFRLKNKHTNNDQLKPDKWCL